MSAPRIRAAKCALAAALAGAGLPISIVATAELGGNESVLTGGRRGLVGGDSEVISTEKYRLHRTTEAGTTVREYAGVDGVVFLVRWEGQAQPDLSRLLGHHFAAYREARGQLPKSGRRGSAEITGDDLVVHHSGHMGALRGEAYLKSRVPEGLSIGGIP